MSAYSLSINRSARVLRIIEIPLILTVTSCSALIVHYCDRGTVLGYAVVETLISLLSGSIVSWYVLDRMRQHAATQYLSYVLPINLTIFGAVLAISALFRMPYSGLMFIVGTTCATAVSFGLAVYGRQIIKTHLIVPGGRVGEVQIEGQFKRAPLEKDIESLIEAGWRDFALVADLHYPHSADWERLFAKASLASVPVYHYRQVAETQSGQVKIMHLSENDLGSLIPNVSYMSVKRILDIVFAFILLPFSIPLFLIIAIVISIDSPGGAFFIQDRIGFRGRKFKMIKFRTMRERSPSVTDSAAREDAMTKSDDARVTRVGKILRKTRIDELPQIFNVLLGEMSFIGPRPEAVTLSEWYEAELPFYSYRHIVRPGITGWAQVRQGHVTDVEDIVSKLRFDFYYIKYISLWLDMLIVLKTFRVIVTGSGAK